MWYKNHLFRFIRYILTPSLKTNNARSLCVKNYYNESKPLQDFIISEGYPSAIDIDGKKYGIEYWKKNSIKLKRKNLYLFGTPLAFINDDFFFTRFNKLYRISNKTKEHLCDFHLKDRRYHDMIYQDGYYVIRNCGELSISKNLHDWEIIYSGKRGIKNSMVFIERNANLYLQFIEYSTGFEQFNHRILEYSFSSKEMRTVKEFYNRTITPYNPECDFARHIHIIKKDPYTGYIYVGTGDFDFEPGIYVSKDNGITYTCLGKGKPMYRTLSFMFTEGSIFWTTDTPEKQFLYKMNKIDGRITEFPVVNSALWCTIECTLDYGKVFLLSSNSEGHLFDNNNRVYGIIYQNDNPQIYEVMCRKSKGVYSQLFPLCSNNRFAFFYDSYLDICLKYELIKTNENVKTNS